MLLRKLHRPQMWQAVLDRKSHETHLVVLKQYKECVNGVTASVLTWLSISACRSLLTLLIIWNLKHTAKPPQPFQPMRSQRPMAHRIFCQVLIISLSGATKRIRHRTNYDTRNLPVYSYDSEHAENERPLYNLAECAARNWPHPQLPSLTS